MKKILFLHGFFATGSCPMAMALKEAFNGTAVVQTPDYVYVFEFKLDGSAEQALQQIEEKGYARPFVADNRKVVKVGVEFSAEQRNIKRWLVES